MTESEVDEAFDRANALLGAGRFEEAVAILRAARDRACTDKDRESEAFLSSVAGSFLASRGHHLEAGGEYARAESSDPSSPAWKIATANHLLSVGAAAGALAKAGEILTAGRGSPSYEHVGYSLLGLAQLALGDEAAALRSFSESAATERVAGLPASARDLRLAERLLLTKPSSGAVHSYLRDARLRALADGDQLLAERVRQLENGFS